MRRISLLDLLPGGDQRSGFVHGVLTALSVAKLDKTQSNNDVLNKLGVSSKEVNYVIVDVLSLADRTKALYDFQGGEE